MVRVLVLVDEDVAKRLGPPLRASGNRRSTSTVSISRSSKSTAFKAKSFRW
jgi:hypothetical protein